MHEGVRCRGESARGRVEARHKRNLETANEFFAADGCASPRRRAKNPHFDDFARLHSEGGARMRVSVCPWGLPIQEGLGDA